MRAAIEHAWAPTPEERLSAAVTAVPSGLAAVLTSLANNSHA